MENLIGLVEYDRLAVISRLKTHIQKLEETKLVKTNEYRQRVKDYKALPTLKRWFVDNPEEKTGWYSTALEYFVSYETTTIRDLQKQIKAFNLSDSPKVWVNSGSWLIGFLE